MFPMSRLPICELWKLHYLSQQVTTSLLPSNTLIAPVYSGELNSSSEDYQFPLSIADVKLLPRELYCSDFGAYRSRIEAGIETWRPYSYSHRISTRKPFLTYKVVPPLLDGIHLNIGANGRQTGRWTFGCHGWLPRLDLGERMRTTSKLEVTLPLYSTYPDPVYSE